MHISKINYNVYLRIPINVPFKKDCNIKLEPRGKKMMQNFHLCGKGKGVLHGRKVEKEE